MKLSQMTKIHLIASMVALNCISVFTTQAAQEKVLDKVVDAGKKINQSANQSQQKIDQINEQIQSKLQAFKTVNKEIDGLNVYNQQMQNQIANQTKELKQLATSMEQVSVIERQVAPLMARMIDTLAAFVELDVPFLPQERSQRIASLKEMLNRADVAVSEKFRRVLEAYQVEVEYGRTIEAYSGLHTVNGAEKDVDFLRIGRVSFVYQTRDGSEMGSWDQASKSWQALPAAYRSDIKKALRIARKQLAPDLIMVPIVQHSAE
ncbi:DUF3450 domain-containing protein [Thalassotalea sp. G2M2-11]|uniref:DUF3450 domain-containing protein n=1 Tax=Thalassotalea sp. G2M2-11 TaxID=2787627 RepID=UPI0019CFA8E0|nr:DUF3450 domain-containing protein [Thalassotalea sp. G2M2-11]